MNKAQASGRVLVIHTLPALMLVLAFLLTISFSSFMLSSQAGYQHGTMLLHSDLFAAYAPIWPGQPISSVATYARQTPESHIVCISGATTPRQQYSGLSISAAPLASSDPTAIDAPIRCASSPKDGIFHQMRVMIELDHVRSLTLESDVLQTDTLLLYWGMPDAIVSVAHDQRLSLRWDRSTYNATALVAEPSFTVQSVTLTAKA